MKLIFATITILLLFNLVSCSENTFKSSTMPPETRNRFEKLVADQMPGMSRESSCQINNLTKAATAAKKAFPKYANKIECGSEAGNYYIFSLTPLEEEKLENKKKCDFSLILYAKKGDNKIYYYWLAQK
ncbi:MAG: hypothetical protein PF689_09280 [Deltaproteobacteria bacterium]|jgi:hypothetical protein|nr:hypothetical protein [Deltaproteobacteria bacterium]